MSIKDKIISVKNKIIGKPAAQKTADKRKDSELSADEVAHEEVFPAEKPRKKCARKTSVSHKAPSKRTRPTNRNYQMIDPDNDTCDSSKS